MRVLVIGGTRFMGPFVVARLAGEGHSVTVFHRGRSGTFLPAGVGEILGDRNSLIDFAADFRRLRPDVVVDMMLLTQAQARDLVNVMRPVAGRLVVASSCDVYLQYDLLRGVEHAPPNDCRVDESSPLRRKLFPYRESVPGADHDLYDYDKILVEREVMSEPALPATALRLPMVYGPGDYQHRFYGWVRRMLDGRPAIIMERGQGEWRITRGYVENCAEATRPMPVTVTRITARRTAFSRPPSSRRRGPHAMPSPYLTTVTSMPHNGTRAELTGVGLALNPRGGEYAESLSRSQSCGRVCGGLRR